jgi:hypothetical protein
MTHAQTEKVGAKTKPGLCDDIVPDPNAGGERPYFPECDPRFGEIPPEYAALDGEEVGSGLPTLGKVGRVLPIGYRDATGKLHREFELVDWTWDVEEELGELAERNQDMSMSAYISEIVGRGLAKLGELDFTKLKRSQRRLVVSQLFHADVLYVYTWIRIAALGKHVRFDEFECEACSFKLDAFAGDLETLEVKAVEGEEVPTAEVELPRGFHYGEAEVGRVTVGPLRWAFMETADASILKNPAKFRIASMKAGIVGLEGVDNGAPVVIARDHARQMGPASVNRIVAAIDGIGGGAVFEVGGECPKCGERFRRAIDWTYDSFFGRSSR